MDRCVLLKTTPEWVVSPRGETTHEGVDVNNTHLSMINPPDYYMMLAISVTIYQYSAYQKQIKAWIESNGSRRCMSPRNIGGKYRCRPHPRWRKCTHQFFFFPEPERVNGTASERRHRLHGDNIVDHVVCLKVEFLWHTVLSNENGEFYTYDIYPYLNRSVCLLLGSPTWWRFNFCSSGSSLVLWWRDAPLVREFQMWGRWCKQWDSHWFQGHKMRFGGIWSTMSW